MVIYCLGTRLVYFPLYILLQKKIKLDFGTHFVCFYVTFTRAYTANMKYVIHQLKPAQMTRTISNGVRFYLSCSKGQKHVNGGTSSWINFKNFSYSQRNKQMVQILILFSFNYNASLLMWTANKVGFRQSILHLNLLRHLFHLQHENRFVDVSLCCLLIYIFETNMGTFSLEIIYIFLLGLSVDQKCYNNFLCNYHSHNQRNIEILK